MSQTDAANPAPVPMRLAEALVLLRRPAPGTAPFRVGLACGFEPLHLGTFLKAHLRQAVPGRPVELETGLFGNLTGTVESLAGAELDAAFVVIEWSDLDPRLGVRETARWRTDALADIVSGIRERAALLRERLARLRERAPVVVSGPTLPLPPVAYTPGWQVSPYEAELRWALAELERGLVEARCTVLSPQRLDELSPVGARRDLRSELRSGFPYTLPHAALLAGLAAQAVAPPARKKGLITDLDETFWKGILLECGAAELGWDLERKARAHGLYQQVLDSLAESGTLIAIASKNDADRVAEAFRRTDLLFPPDQAFPHEVHWEPKSESVRRICAAWNIGADSVVFLDDNAHELAEVKAALPEVECIPFPGDDENAVYRLLERLRDLFGTSAIREEDRLRMASIRAARQSADAESAGTDPEQLLARAEPRLLVRRLTEWGDGRAFELVNKTNQFNLNGRRVAEAEWRRRLERADAFAFEIAYEDRYGPLGKIGVVGGTCGAEAPEIDIWVMSCRAFGRRVEHASLKLLFTLLQTDELCLDFRTTERNQTTAELLRPFGAGEADAPVRVRRTEFEATSPALYHDVTVLPNG